MTDYQPALFADLEPRPYVLTVRQPWAWAIIHAGKDVENRSRDLVYRGRLLIHAASARYDQRAAAYLADLGVDVPADLPRGVIVGSVEVAGSVYDSASSPWAMSGNWHWLLADPVAATSPVALSGQLQIFRAPERWRDAFSD